MEEEYIGVIKQWVGFHCPRDFMLCEGQSLPIRGYEALFSIIGTQYGGDGREHFNLPDLRPKKEHTFYKLNNTAVGRARETGDPGTIGFVEDSTVVYSHAEFSAPEWGNNPKYIICVNGLYPSFD